MTRGAGLGTRKDHVKDRQACCPEVPASPGTQTTYLLSVSRGRVKAGEADGGVAALIALGEAPDDAGQIPRRFAPSG